MSNSTCTEIVHDASVSKMKSEEKFIPQVNFSSEGRKRVAKELKCSFHEVCSICVHQHVLQCCDVLRGKCFIIGQ